MTLRDILTHPALLVGSLIVLIFLGAALLAPVIAPPVDESAPQYIPRFGISPMPKPPGPGHPLGLLSGQYDVFYGLIWGSRIALGLGMIIALGRAVIGVIIGLLAGAYGGLLDAILMRIADAFMAFPMVAAIVVMLALFGYSSEHWASDWSIFHLSRQNQILVLAMVMFGWVPYARLMRGNVLAERERTYIRAARSIGVPRWRLIWRHLFPNSTYGLIALVTSDIGAAIVLVTAFTFIGIFIEEHGMMQAEWGLMLSSSRDWIVGVPSEAFRYWYTYLPVSLAIVLFSTGWSLVGDGLRDVLDPRMRGLKATGKPFDQLPTKVKAADQLVTDASPQSLTETRPVRIPPGTG